MHGSKDVPVVGHSDRGHAEFLHSPGKFLDVASAVEHGIVGMQMQVDELRAHAPRMPRKEGLVLHSNGCEAGRRPQSNKRSGVQLIVLATAEK